MNIRHAPCLSLLFAFITALPTLHAADDASPLLPKDNTAALVAQANRLLDALSANSTPPLLTQAFNQYLDALEVFTATTTKPIAVDVELRETAKLMGKARAIFNRIYDEPQCEKITQDTDSMERIQAVMQQTLDRSTEGERAIVALAEKHAAFLALNAAIFALMIDAFYKASGGINTRSFKDNFTEEQFALFARAFKLSVNLDNRSLLGAVLRAVYQYLRNSASRCSIQ
ncbi:hypothetical protein EBZ39_07205 [bacterium]|nr:hypothetical protein [bacterium]